MFGGGLLFDAENNVIGTTNTDGGVTFTNSFESVFKQSYEVSDVKLFFSFAICYTFFSLEG
jgi:hypothetical protein